MNTKALLKYFAYFILIFIGLLGFASLENIEAKLGKWFISSSSSFFEWTMPKASFNIEHDRNSTRYDPNEVWISPLSKAWLAEALEKSRREGKSLEIENEASLFFKIGTFPKTSLVFLLALILATPLALRAKGKALLIGLLCFMLYFYLFIYATVMHHLAVTRIGVYELTGTSFAIITFLKNTFCNFGFSLTFALIVWLITSIDFNALLNQFNSALAGPKPAPKKAKTKPLQGKKKKTKNK